jgi:transposase-like protein
MTNWPGRCSRERSSAWTTSIRFSVRIKDVVETAMGAEMSSFLGYDRDQTPDSAPGNRRNGYSRECFPSALERLSS